LGKDDASKVNVALIAALAALDKAGSVLKVAGDAAALKQSQTAIAAWHDAFAEIVKIVETRVARINSWTKDEGEVMAKGADALRAQAQLAADRAQGAVNATVSRSRTMLLVSVAIILLIGIALSLVLALSITRPLARMTGALKALAGGNRGIEVPETLRRDEIGAMAKAAQVFKENLIEGDRLREDQAEAKRRAEAEKRAAMQQLADEFEATVTSVVDAVSSASNELQATAQSLSSTAEETSRQSTAVAAASEQASANVHQVATAAEELSSSIAEIGRRVGDSARIADQAKGQASETNAQIQSLAEAAQRIGDVVKLITEIASQTNLLALNATIEASRAGEAGKGFAVVASEVKSLANQTAKATEDIKTKIAEMQAVTGASVTAVHTIAETIARIDQITTMIASAVEQQGAATMEIARNVQQASDGTAGVTSSISSVRQAASDSGAASSHVLTASSELARNAETLRGQVDAFVTKVRTA
jgi:methyl-accepting chemotaxis protein